MPIHNENLEPIKGNVDSEEGENLKVRAQSYKIFPIFL